MAQKKRIRKVSAAKPAKEDPEYMVQVTDPAALRKDLLESLREIIIFMQGYEKFRQIQEEKIATFATLKADVKELSGLLDTRLRRFFPKGKLKGMIKHPESTPAESQPEVKKPHPMSRAPRPTTPKSVEESYSPSELEELESQLKDIESQLQGIK